MDFKIYDGRKEFWQWDLNQKILIEDSASCQEVHFCKCGSTQSLVVLTRCEPSGRMVCDVPNVLLQTAENIKVFTVITEDERQTTHLKIFRVRQRARPADYVYTETEAKTWDELDDRLDVLEAIDHAEPISNNDINYMMER